jgi:hypothetical protein
MAPNWLISQHLNARNQANTFYPNQNQYKIWIISLRRILSTHILCIKCNTGAYPLNHHDNGLYKSIRTTFQQPISTYFVLNLLAIKLSTRFSRVGAPQEGQ